MKRRWIPIEEVEIYDDFHYKVGDSFEVNVELDGNTTEHHKKGIEYIKSVLSDGSKTLPILVVEHLTGYILLDGFKRSMAHRELGYKHIEAFICDPWEYGERKEIPWHGKTIRCYKGGLNYEVFGLFEADEKENFEYDKLNFLYKDDSKPHGLRIEISENIHVHWGEYGKHRLSLGREDFLALARAVMAIDG